MEIQTKRYTELDVCEIRKMPKIFELQGKNGRYCCYIISENLLKLCMEKSYIEMSEYVIYEIGSDKGVFFVVELAITDIGIMRGHVPSVSFDIVGADGVAATKEIEAIKFLIARIKKSFADEKLGSVGMEHLEETLQKSLLPAAVKDDLEVNRDFYGRWAYLSGGE